MAYEVVESDFSGGGSENMDIYLYPNAPIDDEFVDAEGSVTRDAAVIFGDQLINADLINSYTISISWEHPRLDPKNDVSKTMKEWTKYDGENNKLSVTGCHLLVYHVIDALANGAADPVDSGAGAFAESKSCAAAYSAGNTYAKEKNITIHEIGHTFIVDDTNDTSPTRGLGDDDYGDYVDHELGKVYPGLLGDGPISPMSSGYEDSEGREGDCSNDAPWNTSYDDTLTSCTKEAIERTTNNQ